MNYKNPNDATYPMSGGTDAIAKILKKRILETTDSEVTGNGQIYYISSQHGDDDWEGTSPQRAWKSLEGYRKHRALLKEGDMVLFERNGIYRGEVHERTLLYLISGVTYGAYGLGNKPAIYGSKENYCDIRFWKKYEMKNVWECPAELFQDAGTIIFDHGKKIGIKKLKSFETLEENIQMLTEQFEFYHDLESGSIYLYLENAPYENYSDIEICAECYMVLGDAGCHDISINNLCMKYSGGHAIRFQWGVKNIKITNCEIGYCGGSLQQPYNQIRYGNAIEFWDSCNNVLIENNYIYQIYDAAFTHQGGGEGPYVQEDIAFKDNLIEFCSYPLEFWGGNPGQDLLRNILYEGNIVRFTGYGWGMLRPDADSVAAVNLWGHTGYFRAENIVLRNNSFDLSEKYLIMQYYEEQPNIVYEGNSYYQSEGYVALWTGKNVLQARSQKEMEASVREIDRCPRCVQYLELRKGEQHNEEKV